MCIWNYATLNCVGRGYLYYRDDEDSLFSVMQKINAKSYLYLHRSNKFSTHISYNNVIIVTDFRGRNLYYKTVYLLCLFCITKFDILLTVQINILRCTVSKILWDSSFVISPWNFQFKMEIPKFFSSGSTSCSFTCTGNFCTIYPLSLSLSFLFPLISRAIFQEVEESNVVGLF